MAVAGLMTTKTSASRGNLVGTHNRGLAPTNGSGRKRIIMWKREERTEMRGRSPLLIFFRYFRAQWCHSVVSGASIKVCRNGTDTSLLY